MCLCIGHRCSFSFWLLGSECRSKLSVTFWSTNLTFLREPVVVAVVERGGRVRKWLDEGGSGEEQQGGEVSREREEPGVAIMSPSLRGLGWMRAYSVPLGAPALGGRGAPSLGVGGGRAAVLGEETGPENTSSE